MTSLLYKDWSIIKKTKALYFALLYFFFILPSFQNTDFFGKTFSANFFFIFVIYLLFSYLTAYDYKYNSNTFMPAFPVTKKDIVAGRYVFVGLTFAACLILLSVARIVVLAIKGQELNIMNGMDYGQTGILISVFSLYFGIVLPLYYKFGYQKVRWLMMVATIISGAASSALSEIGPDLNQPLFMFFAAIIGAVIYYFSFTISVNIFKNEN
jgi:ABC-2 type transport system permease protein